MKLFAVTDIGQKRSMNQDYIYGATEPTGILPNLFIVADGMGGHNAGDFASRFAVEEFVREVREKNRKTVISTVEHAIAQVNEKLLDEAEKRPELAGMGTTFVVAVLTEREMYVANIGDSRLYVINKEQIRQITQDHSLVEEMIRRGEIEREAARFHPNKNVITRALGVNVDVVPDFFEVALTEEDTVLLCSDGLSNMVGDEEIRAVVLDAGEDLDEAGKRLLQLANENGGRDNISIVLVRREAGDHLQ
ncbi:MAG: Stp1/IreP family PP2C-type Ser/Thr phosphatase [Lachnospiraceae bacterium]|nr:Stp1/IreP family PP2C-type Ser/Thr phosphatase [Lachnospiraceae bacterium]